MFGAIILQQCLLIFNGLQSKVNLLLILLVHFIIIKVNNGIQKHLFQEYKKEVPKLSMQEDYQVQLVQVMQLWHIWKVGSKVIIMIGYLLVFGQIIILMMFLKDYSIVSQWLSPIDNGVLWLDYKSMKNRELRWLKLLINWWKREKLLSLCSKYDFSEWDHHSIRLLTIYLSKIIFIWFSLKSLEVIFIFGQVYKNLVPKTKIFLLQSLIEV